jgi:c-di-GMP-related signal transduction protein
MIAIVNMGPRDPKDPLGWRNYEVRINADVVTTFRHKRSDGLGKCLLEASKAVERQKWRNAAEMLRKIHEENVENQATASIKL